MFSQASQLAVLYLGPQCYEVENKNLNAGVQIEIIIIIKQCGLQFMTSLKTEAHQGTVFLYKEFYLIHSCEQKQQFSSENCNNSRVSSF